MARVRGVIAASTWLTSIVKSRSVHVDEDRTRPGVDDAVGARDERERDGDHLVARREAVPEQSQVQRGGAGARGDRMRDPDEVRESLLELSDPRPLREGSGGHRLPDSFLLLVAHLRAGDGDHVAAASSAAAGAPTTACCRSSAATMRSAVRPSPYSSGR